MRRAATTLALPLDGGGLGGGDLGGGDVSGGDVGGGDVGGGATPVTPSLPSPIEGEGLAIGQRAGVIWPYTAAMILALTTASAVPPIASSRAESAALGQFPPAACS